MIGYVNFVVNEGTLWIDVGISMVSPIGQPKVLSCPISNIPKVANVTLAFNVFTSFSTVPKDVIQISKEEYDRLLHSQPSSIVSHAL